MTGSFSVTAFAAACARSFPLAPPVSYRMRELSPARWLRIHSLPGSKRYPEDDAEYAELLARHNAAATDLFGDGAPVVVVAHAYFFPGEPELEGPPELPVALAEPLRRVRRVDARELHPHADPAEDAAVDLWAAPAVWRAGAFDPMIRAAADGRGPSVLLATPDAERVYAPYDGGADLYLETRAVRDAFKARYAAWLSAEPSGL